MRLLGFKSFIIFLVIIIIASCKSNLEKIPLSDIQSHRNYQDSIYKLDLVPINQLKRLKSLINEYKLHESEWSKDPNYSYYLLRLYGRIDNLPFKGFLYDTINKRLNYRQDYINFYDSVLFYGSKALTDNSSNIYSLFILANSMYYNTERSILTNNSDVPSYLKSKPVVYNNMAMHIMNNCHLYKQFDTTKNKYLIRGIYEIALFFLNNSSRFKSNYSYSASDDKKTNALYKYGEFYDFLKEFSDYAVIKWDYSYIKRNILPNIILARNDIDQRNKEFLAKKAEEEFNLVKVDHKYSYCDPENGVFAMLDLYGSDSYTQSAKSGTFTTSGRGTYSRKGHKISFFRTSGVAINGDAIIRSVGDKIEIILPKGVRYIEDDDLYYIKNSISTKSETDNQQNKFLEDYNNKHTCSDQRSFDEGYDLARQQYGVTIDIDLPDYLYKISVNLGYDYNPYCFKKGIEQYIIDKN